MAVETIINKHNKIDVLINNAGINLPRLLVDYREENEEYQMNERDLDKMFNINLKGPVWLSQEVAKTQIKNKKES